MVCEEEEEDFRAGVATEEEDEDSADLVDFGVSGVACLGLPLLAALCLGVPLALGLIVLGLVASAGAPARLADCLVLG